MREFFQRRPIRQTIEGLAKCGSVVTQLIEGEPWIKEVLELGCSVGVTARAIMDRLPHDGRLVSINLPNTPEEERQHIPRGAPQLYSGDDVASLVLPKYGNDPRFTLILGDTILVRDQVTGMFDLLFIDSLHTAAHAREEWRLYQTAMRPGSIVVIDDLNQGDMIQFWNELPYDKMIMSPEIMDRGVFRYDS